MEGSTKGGSGAEWKHAPSFRRKCHCFGQDPQEDEAPLFEIKNKYQSQKKTPELETQLRRLSILG
jgi:hypothetical protein